MCKKLLKIYIITSVTDDRKPSKLERHVINYAKRVRFDVTLSNGWYFTT